MPFLTSFAARFAIFIRTLSFPDYLDFASEKDNVRDFKSLSFTFFLTSV
jgi:predicted component of type VI protein secretion system